MQETIDQPLTASVETGSLVTAAARAAEWAGEPFVHPDEDVAQVLTPGTARRIALDDAIAEIEAGNDRPSSEWKIRYALMLGLERVLSERPPHLKSGTELRRHQIDALAGMLTELIAAAQREPEAVEEPEDDFEEEEEYENGDSGENGEALEIAVIPMKTGSGKLRIAALVFSPSAVCASSQITSWYASRFRSLT